MGTGAGAGRARLTNIKSLGGFCGTVHFNLTKVSCPKERAVLVSELVLGRVNMLGLCIRVVPLCQENGHLSKEPISVGNAAVILGNVYWSVVSTPTLCQCTLFPLQPALAGRHHRILTFD